MICKDQTDSRPNENQQSKRVTARYEVEGNVLEQHNCDRASLVNKEIFVFCHERKAGLLILRIAFPIIGHIISNHNHIMLNVVTLLKISTSKRTHTKSYRLFFFVFALYIREYFITSNNDPRCHQKYSARFFGISVRFHHRVVNDGCNRKSVLVARYPGFDE